MEYDKVFIVRVTAKDHIAVQKLAKLCGSKISTLIRKILKEGIDARSSKIRQSDVDSEEDTN